MGTEKIKLIAFDIDGTLAETDDYYIEKGVSLMRKVFPFVKPASMEKIVRLLVMVGETILHSFYRILDYFGLDTVISKIHSKISVDGNYKYRAVTGMKKTLKLLSKHYSIGIITSGGHQSTKAFIEKFKLEKIVNHVISSEDCEFIKPHPMPLIKMAETANIKPENILMVGDTVFDILCAKRAGSMSAAVKSGFDTEWFLKTQTSDFLLKTVNDLPKILGL